MAFSAHEQLLGGSVRRARSPVLFTVRAGSWIHDVQRSLLLMLLQGHIQRKGDLLKQSFRAEIPKCRVTAFESTNTSW